MMTEKFLLLAMFIQVLFPVVTLLIIFYLRMKSVLAKEVSIKYYKSFNLKDIEIPEIIHTTSRHYTNLFEMPILFLILGTLLISLQLVSPGLVISAWLFVVLRFIHSIIHLTYNNVLHRMLAFGMSCAVLLGMWITFIGKIFLF
jgi:hypothetical protein